MNNSNFIKDFVEEASMHVDEVERGLLSLCGEMDVDKEIINDIFRNVHSIKGTASFFSLKNIVELSHVMENLLGEIRNGSKEINRELVDGLLSANDCLRAMIADVENSEKVDISLYIKKITLVSESNVKPQLSAGENKKIHPDIELISIDEESFNSGQRLYVVTYPQGRDISDIIENARSIGKILGFLTNSGIINNTDPSGNEIGSGLLVSTVLEEDFLAEALNIEDQFIDEYTDINQIKVSETETLPEVSVEPLTSYKTVNQVVPEESSEINYGHQNVEGAEQQQLKKRAQEETIRVHISLLNDLLNLASEMVLGRNQLLRILETHRKEISGLNTVLQNIDNLTTELQEKIMQTRMQPVAKVFNKFPRIIRDLSKQLGKEINLQMEGTEVELDKSIIEALGDPLTHLVRNAVDHGIEAPSARENSGKPRTGTVLLRAYHEGGHVNIDINDDGAGINVDSIKTKALEKGIISQSEIAFMGERELLELLFRPGFSTAERVTDVSGRGVGMDVVKTNIEKLGGTMEIMTSPGKNTTFRLTLPLTLAIISSLIVEANDYKFALPQVNLQGLVRIKPGDTERKIERIKDSLVLRFRGKLLPVVHLSEVLSLKKNSIDTQEVVRILVIKSGSRLFGLGVDNIHDGEEILVKPLPRYLSECQCYSGVTIMGDGRTAMILDPEGIIEKAGLRYVEETNDLTGRGYQDSEHSMTERQNLLLFKCSGPENYVIDLSMVARVEKIDRSQIEKIGSKEYMQFRGESLRLIRPEHYLPVKRGKNQNRKLYVVIPKLGKYQVGMLIDKIIDTTETEILNIKDDIKAKGLVGSAVLENRIVLLINIYELFEMAVPEIIKEEFVEPGSKKTVLLAEDTPFFIKMEKKYLESAGYSVITALNGKEAWKLLQENAVDALVSDIEMPLMDGYELIRKIRSDKNYSNLPAIAVTSKTDSSSVMEGLEAGFDFYEIKLDKERLIEKLRMAFEKRGETM
ncbi:MAG: chemotaxis protein CheW [Bacillota bacterium]